MWEITIAELAEELREEQTKFEAKIRRFVQKVKDSTQDLGDKGECIAQAMLALRAHEESKMRLGKVIQYAGDGVSVYDKK